MKFDTQLIVIINLDWMSVTHSQLNIAYNLYTYIHIIYIRLLGILIYEI